MLQLHKRVLQHAARDHRSFVRVHVSACLEELSRIPYRVSLSPLRPSSLRL